MRLYQLTDDLKTECPFEFNKDKKIGHIRCQFGNEKQIANQFVPYEDMSDKVKKFNLDLKPINVVCDLIQFEWIVNYTMIENLCNGKETNFFFQDEQIDYWIRLNPFGTSDYNCYIHMYHK